MEQLLAVVFKLADIGLILVGFGLVVFIHELGHFLAAKWAGVRVLAFAIGFGPAAFSYRRGMGLRRGSTEHEYQRWLVSKADGLTAPNQSISATEYRFNALPLGGYVKMLGQDDANPAYRSAEPDSYNVVPIWKRMVIISAGVTMNIAAAATLYVAVFMLGLRTEAPTVGDVAPGSPAAITMPENASELAIADPGILPGDRITFIAGREPSSFSDIQLASAMASAGEPMEVRTRRDGYADEIRFRITPVKSEIGLLTIGVAPSQTNTLIAPTRRAESEDAREVLRDKGLDEVPLGASLVAINGSPVARPSDFVRPISHAMGAPVLLRFEKDEQIYEASTTPRPLMDIDSITIAGQKRQSLSVLGLTPVMQVGELDPETSKGYKQGLREGDIFARLGSAGFPSMARGTAEVHARAGSTIEATVLRDGKPIDLTLKVSRQGQVGFTIDWKHEHTYLAEPLPAGGSPRLDLRALRPGSRIVSVRGEPVTTFAGITRQLQLAVAEGLDDVPVTSELPIAGDDGEPLRLETTLTLTPEQAGHLAAIEWSLPRLQVLFEQEMTTLKASGPLAAIAMGVRETDRVMRTTYLTFLRLFQGSISPKNLNGPVGIVHTGTIVAERGIIWLLFFFALVNINLAVVNFLPVPITDGGHMIFLIWEQLTGRPVSVAVQNAATLAGLVLIVAVFLFVTYNDISRLLGA